MQKKITTKFESTSSPRYHIRSQPNETTAPYSSKLMSHLIVLFHSNISKQETSTITYMVEGIWKNSSAYSVTLEQHSMHVVFLTEEPNIKEEIIMTNVQLFNSVQLYTAIFVYSFRMKKRELFRTLGFFSYVVSSKLKPGSLSRHRRKQVLIPSVAPL